MNYHVISINGSLSDKLHSHRAAWVRMRGIQELTRGNKFISYNNPYAVPFDKFKADDQTLVYLGMEWSGLLNLFGGTTDDNANTIALAAKNHKLTFLDEPADIVSLMISRRAPSNTLWHKTTIDERVVKAYGEADVLAQPDFDDIVIGDSHALSWFQHEHQNVFRYDGQTLYGACARGLYTLLKERKPKAVSVVLGSIDCRHHLMRRPDPFQATIELGREYARQLKLLRILNPDLQTLRVAEMIPIEHESRNMSKSGYYKGTPFKGTREQRTEIRDLFNGLLQKLQQFGIVDEVLQYPAYLYPGNTMDQNFMERPRGVHLSWEHSAYNRSLDDGSDK